MLAAMLHTVLSRVSDDPAASAPHLVFAEVLVDRYGANVDAPMGARRLVCAHEEIDQSVLYPLWEPHFPRWVDAKLSSQADEGYRPLHTCVLAESMDGVMFLLSRHASVNARTISTQLSPLHVAASTLNIEIVELLCEAGADVNSKDREGRCPIHYALVSSGSSDPLPMMKLLKRRGAELDSMVAELVCSKNAPHVLEWLRDEGAPFGDVGVLISIVGTLATGDRKEIVDLLNKDVATDSSAMRSAAVSAISGLSQDLAVPIIAGLRDSPDENGITLLHVACAFGAKRCVEELLRHSPQSVAARDARGRVPLHLAVQCDRRNDDGAAKLRDVARLETAQLLLDADVSAVNAVDENGSTPLHFACSVWDHEMVRLLLSRGANPNARDAAGVSPLLGVMMSHKTLVYLTRTALLQREPKGARFCGCVCEN